MPRLVAGLVAVAVGAAADGISGAVVFTRGGTGGAVLIALLVGFHLMACALWLSGVVLVTSAPAGSPATWHEGDVRGRRVSGWVVVAGGMGLCLFPGIGTLGCTVAILLSYLLSPGRLFGRSPHHTVLQSVRLQALVARPTQAPRHTVRPLVDVLREQNTEMRRVAVKQLGEQGDRESVQLLRSLLADPNLDVRSDAAVALTRLEDEYSAAIVKARTQAAKHGSDPDQQLALARLYARYGRNGLLDKTSARLYSREAQDILERQLEQSPNRVETLFELARVRWDMGATQDALTLIERVLQLRPQHAEAYLLALEFAFHLQQWDTLARLLAEPVTTPETQPIVEWWSRALQELQHVRWSTAPPAQLRDSSPSTPSASFSKRSLPAVVHPEVRPGLSAPTKPPRTDHG